MEAIVAAAVSVLPMLLATVGRRKAARKEYKPHSHAFRPPHRQSHLHLVAPPVQSVGATWAGHDQAFPFHPI